MRTVLLLEGPVMASFGAIVLLTTAHHRVAVALACFALALVAPVMALGTRHRIRAARAYYGRSPDDGWEPAPHDVLVAAGAPAGSPRGGDSWQ